MEEIREIKLSGKHGGVAKVSAVDFDRVSKYKWYTRSGYACSKQVGMMHKFILGERSNDIPSDYVIDHKNREKTNNCRSNLRYTSESFNSWNRVTVGNSIYRGVYWSKKDKKFHAKFLGENLGTFDNERKAGWIAARNTVRTWPLWSIDSDFLIGPGLFSKEDIKKMQEEIVEDVKPIRELPKGVHHSISKKYMAKYSLTYLGTFETVEEAKSCYDSYVQKLHDSAWEKHKLLEITRDSDNYAIIALSGKKGEGSFTRVPDKFWHQLTFKTSWNLSHGYATGYWDGKVTSLHIVIYKLLNPEYIYTEENSIDHIIPENKLDNREENLREATNSEQCRNKQKRANCTSKYIGISFQMARGRWRGEITINKICHFVHAKTEKEALDLLNAKKKELLGTKAKITEFDG